MLAEGIAGGFAALYDSLAQLETLGVCRRGYFIEGLGGAQFALPGAVERLRAQRDLDQAPALVLAASDPAQPFGAALPWPEPAARRGKRRPARPRGAARRASPARTSCWSAPRSPATSRPAGAGCRRSSPASRCGSPSSALADAVRAGRIRKLELERIDGEPVLGGPAEALLVELGFRSGPRRLTLSA